MKILDDLFENVWGDKDVVEIDNITDLTVPVCNFLPRGLTLLAPLPLTESARRFLVQITLMVISVAGFGRRAMWKEDAQAPPGHQLTFTVSGSSPCSPEVRPHAILVSRPHYIASPQRRLAEPLPRPALPRLAPALGHAHHAQIPPRAQRAAGASRRVVARASFSTASPNPG